MLPTNLDDRIRIPVDLPEGAIAQFHFRTRVAMQQFGFEPDDIYVSRNQLRPNGSRGVNEATYCQSSGER